MRIKSYFIKTEKELLDLRIKKDNYRIVLFDRSLLRKYFIHNKVIINFNSIRFDTYEFREKSLNLSNKPLFIRKYRLVDSVTLSTYFPESEDHRRLDYYIKHNYMYNWLTNLTLNFIKNY